MITAIKRQQIVNSYAKVLVDILSTATNLVNEFNDCKIAISLLRQYENNEINPLEMRGYKDAIAKIKNELDINSGMQKFLFTLFSRRYGFLLPDIIEKVEYGLQDKLNNRKIVVCSRNELIDALKKSIEKTILAQVNNAVIEYKVDKGITTDSVDFVSNGNITSINFNELLNKFLAVK